MLNQTSSLVECPLDFNSSYSCDHPYPNCTNPLGFQLSIMWTISQNIYMACPTDWRIFDQAGQAISEAACEQIVGSTWTYYPRADIWARLTTWKFPLLQLVAMFSKPPLSYKVGIFVVFHLLGDPVSTIRDLLRKFSTCQSRAQFWDYELSHSLCHVIHEDDPVSRHKNRVRKWKALAIIVDAYDEWGQDKGDCARDFLYEVLYVRGHLHFLSQN